MWYHVCGVCVEDEKYEEEDVYRIHGDSVMCEYDIVSVLNNISFDLNVTAQCTQHTLHTNENQSKVLDGQCVVVYQTS